jgi:MFS family permease
MPVLIVTLFLNVYAAFFWTIGPLFANTLTTLGSLEGIFMTAFLLPTFISGWLVGRITFRRGKKRLAILAIAVGSLFLTTVGFFENDLIFVLVTFVSSFFVSLALPAINGAFADYISEARKISTEIVTLEDSFTNIGYIIGPIVAGVVSDFFGYTFAFSFLGFSGLVIAAILWRITPRSINVAPIAKRY